MRLITLEDITLDEPIQNDLYNKSGVVLLAKGTVFTQHHMELLKGKGIEDLYLDEEEAPVSQKLIPLQIQDLPLDQRLMFNIYYKNGLLILSKGTYLKHEHIDILKSSEINTVYRYEDEGEGVVASREPAGKTDSLDEKVNEKFMQGKLLEDEMKPAGKSYIEEVGQEVSVKKRTKTVFNKLVKEYNNLTGVTEDIFCHALKGEAIDYKYTQGYISGILQEFWQNSSLMVSLKDFAVKDSYLFTHSTNVFLMCTFVGIYFGLSKDQLIDLGTASLLHDLGMLKVPPEILKKRGPLTSEEWWEVKKHPIHGVNMLERHPSINDRVLLIIYQHHERRDGSGYPKKRLDFMIHPYSKILGIADSYDAMSSDRAYRKKRVRYKAMEEILLEAKKMYDPKIVRKFLEAFSLFPIGSIVRTNNNDIGRVLKSNFEDYTRPIIRIIKDKNGNITNEGIILDLIQHSSLKIVSVLNLEEIKQEGLEEFGY